MSHVLAPRRDATPGSVGEMRVRLAAERARLRSDYLARADARRLLLQHRQLVDRVMRETWVACRMPKSLALVAVGGYGRGILFPYSDVDILVLLPRPAGDGDKQPLEAFIGRLWDVGVELGHSVRTVADCREEASKDLTVLTSLLEARLIIGSRKLYGALRASVEDKFDPKAFFKGKRLEQDQRHAKFHDSPYSLEPNVKESPGGLRDLQVILWVSRASGLGRSWRELAGAGYITREEARSLTRQHDFLQEIRARLHFFARRREDRLLFDYQDALAKSFGFEGTAARRPSEVFMQRYFRAAKAVLQLNTIVLQNLGAAIFPGDYGEPVPLNERFSAVRELLDARRPDLFEREPAAILESFLLLQQHPELKGMTAPTLRALWRARMRIDASFRRDPANRARFMEILQQPRGIVHELRRMNQYSILGRYLPAFGKIIGQMQHDLYHVYTVDQHILTVVRNVRRFTMVEFAHEYPICSRLIANFERPWVLYVATIFHDIAKGRGGDHSKLGAVDARRFCRAHRLAKEDTELIGFLVKHHLTMSFTAQRRDLSDADVIGEFAAIVKTERRLVALYLLTVADIRGTSPKVWNAWKGKLLEDLFRATRRLLRGAGVGFDVDMQAKQAEALRLLRLYALSDSVGEALWRELDVAYFLRHDAQEIAWQTRTLHFRVAAPAPVVKARLSPIGEGLQVMIYAKDERDLFARICGFFERLNYNIDDAKIHTTRHRYALDTFLVLGSGTSPHYREMINLIEHDLGELLERRAPLPPPLRGGRVSRQLKHFPIQPEVQIRPDEKGQYHLLSITAGDRPGLLYGIARILGQYGLDLHTAKIVTLGERAEDVFVVSGRALASTKVVLLLEQDLLRVLE